MRHYLFILLLACSLSALAQTGRNAPAPYRPPASGGGAVTTSASSLTTGTLPDARLSGNIARQTDVTAAVSTTVSSFTLAKTMVTTGIPKQFTILNNELFGAPTNSVYTGTDWFHSPALIQNN